MIAPLTGQQRGKRAVATRVFASVCAIASGALVIYCVMLVYAAATFEHDSLPGPAVLYMVAVAVGLAALLCGGLAHVLWTASKRKVGPTPPDARGDPRSSPSLH